MHPRAEAVAPGVWRLALRTPTLPPASATNTLVVVGDGVAVIEPATPHGDERAVLDEVLAGLARAGHPLVAIAVTHHHADHTGYAAELSARHGVAIHAHADTATRVGFAVDRELAHGDRIELGAGVTLRAEHTPGHAPGHLVFVEERSGVAHVGDLVAGEGTILVDPDDAGDMAAYLDSLARLGAMGLAAAVPAHGPVLPDVPAIAGQYVAHRLAREAKVVAALTAEPRALDDIVPLAYADTPQWLWPLARQSARAHLAKLVSDGRVIADADRWSSR